MTLFTQHYYTYYKIHFFFISFLTFNFFFLSGDNYTYESPFEPKWIDIYEEYHELWYKYNIQTEETTLWNEIEKKRKGFNQFAAARPPSTPIDVSLDQIAEDLDNPSCGMIWNAPNDSGDQPMEHCQIEGAAIAKEEENIVDLNQYNWVCYQKFQIIYSIFTTD